MQAPAHVRSLRIDRSEARRDPYLQPQTSLRNKLGRVAWGVVCTLLFRWTPRPLHGWRAFLLRCFGAQLGPDCHIYPGARIWAPWNLVCADQVAIADEAVVYNAATVTLGSHAIVSQQAYLCSATHDMDDPAFPMIVKPISHRRLCMGVRACVCAARRDDGRRGRARARIGGDERHRALAGFCGQSGTTHPATKANNEG